MSLDDAREELRETIAELIELPSGSLAQQEGIDHWVKDWKSEYDADPRAAEVLVEAMAALLQDLRKQGKSTRTLNGIYSDLQALGQLNFGYDRPCGEEILRKLSSWSIEFNRKYACTPNQTRRYERTCEQFRKYLKGQKHVETLK